MLTFCLFAADIRVPVSGLPAHALAGGLFFAATPNQLKYARTSRGYNPMPPIPPIPPHDALAMYLCAGITEKLGKNGKINRFSRFIFVAKVRNWGILMLVEVRNQRTGPVYVTHQ